MGKRSNFERVERDYYPTPLEAVLPLIPHLKDSKTFYEPCCGDGRLVSHLENFNLKCVGKSDIEPLCEDALTKSAFDLTEYDLNFANLIITNPPWDRKILHPMIEHFKTMTTTWLLFDADWAHTKQSSELIRYCSKIVSVGRVKWFGNMSGKENCAWYEFKPVKVSNTLFYGRW